ncbi:carbohydrate ABC transporter permease [Umezawaea sp. Da 62-37]|uniref:carbohydrate ABC transporter permease n=1 Tax=Umezawaea sp. Da 62-37 TaxID=3075927 RepID=UPI0028F6CED0|nr:carbohydrate ABC transporter permease [Umezawaea sp. Da 62-37]WNV87550.1 carbohydrate ABC transporter permease [Umezawaea sp. Da 62-37]
MPSAPAVTGGDSRVWRDRGGRVAAHTFLIAAVIALAGPFLWELLTSFKTLAESTKVPPTVLPEDWHGDNYGEALTGIPMWKMLGNSVVNAIVRTLGQLLFCSMAAYAFARLDFPGRRVLFGLFLTVLLVPSQLLVIPQYQIMQDLNLLNTLTAVFLPGMFSAFGTFLLRQFFLALPVELEEAARLDGASPLRIYWSVLLPLARPGLIALGILTMIWSWNDLLWPLIVTTDTANMTLSVGLTSLQGQFQTDYPVLMAGSLLATLPVIAVFVVLQKHVIEGIALSGSKG